MKRAIIQPSQTVPPNSEFKGYQDYTVQELIIKPHNVRASTGKKGKRQLGKLSGEN